MVRRPESLVHAPSRWLPPLVAVHSHRILGRFFLDRLGVPHARVPPRVLETREPVLRQLVVGRRLTEAEAAAEVPLRDYAPLREAKVRALEAFLRALYASRPALAAVGLTPRLKEGGGGSVFAGFAGVFVDVMRMPFDVETFAVHAWRDQSSGLIRFKKGKEASADDQANERARVCRAAFARMISTREEVVDRSHEAAKDFKVTRVSLGRHTLLILSEVNGVDREGREVKLVSRIGFANHGSRDRWSRTRALELWAHALLTNQRTLVSGIWDRKREAIVDVVVQDPLEVMAHARSAEGLALAHLHDLLDQVVRALDSPEAAAGRVVSFLYVKGREQQELRPLIQSEAASAAIKRVRQWPKQRAKQPARSAKQHAK